MIIQNVPAGSVLSDLGFFCRDEAEQSVTNGVQGKVQLSWSRGSKRVVLEEGIVCLPDMPVSSTLLPRMPKLTLPKLTLHSCAVFFISEKVPWGQTLAGCLVDVLQARRLASLAQGIQAGIYCGHQLTCAAILHCDPYLLLLCLLLLPVICCYKRAGETHEGYFVACRIRRVGLCD